MSDESTELLRKILEKLDAIDSSIVSIQNDVSDIRDERRKQN